MMPIVRPAACAGAPRPDSTNGLAAAPPRKVLRERVLREMERVIIDNTPSWPWHSRRRRWGRKFGEEKEACEGALRRERQDHRFHHPFLAFGLGSFATFVEPAPSRPPA